MLIRYAVASTRTSDSYKINYVASGSDRTRVNKVTSPKDSIATPTTLLNSIENNRSDHHVAGKAGYINWTINQVVPSYLVLPTVSFPTMTTLSGRVKAAVPPLKMSSKYRLTARIPPATNASGGCSHGFASRNSPPIPSSLSKLSRREANAPGRVPGTHDTVVRRKHAKLRGQRPTWCACIHTTHACMYTGRFRCGGL